jgi:predicted DNA-binding protein (UPF0278 family)
VFRRVRETTIRSRTMAETFEQRAIRNLRQRHRDAIRKAALDIQDRAGYLLRELDAGVGILSGSLAGSAAEIDRHVSALEAIRESAEIWESSDTGQPPLPASHAGHPVDPRRNTP